MGGDNKSSASEPADWPDQKYLETMKLRTKGLPTMTAGNQLLKSSLLNTMENKDMSDPNLDKQVERAASPHSSNFSESNGGSAKKGPDSSNYYSLRARREAAEAKRLGQGGSNYNTISGTPDKNIGSQSMATLPVAGVKDTRQPKQLMNKFSNLMKATKSSAQRNQNMGKINSNYQTVDGDKGILSNDNPKTRSPVKRGKVGSPMRAGLRPKSPSMKNKSQSVINLKSTPNKNDAPTETHFLLQSNMNFNFDELDDSNDASQEQEECQQVNLNFTEEF